MKYINKYSHGGIINRNMNDGPILGSKITRVINQETAVPKRAMRLIINITTLLILLSDTNTDNKKKGKRRNPSNRKIMCLYSFYDIS